jgi:hypothetical protein
MGSALAVRTAVLFPLRIGMAEAANLLGKSARTGIVTARAYLTVAAVPVGRKMDIRTGRHCQENDCWIGGVRRRLRAWLRSPIVGIGFRRSSSSTP